MTKENMILEIINEWDPIKLFPMAPLNEYEVYARKISNFIDVQEKVTSAELTAFVDEMFRASFGDIYSQLNIIEPAIVVSKILDNLKTDDAGM